MNNFKQKKPRYELIGLLSLLSGAIAVLDIYAGSQISPWAIYLLPIGLAGWLGGASIGFGMALLATGFSFLSASITGHPLQNWFYFTLSVSNRIICFVIVAFLSSYLWESLEYLRKLTNSEKI